MAISGFKFMRALARLRGWELYKKSQLDRLETAQTHLERFFRHNHIAMLVDCGANQGQFGLLCRAAGYTGHILSIEPVAEAFTALKRVCATDSDWTAVQCALGAEETERDINVSQATELSSYFSPRQGPIDVRFRKRQKTSVTRLDRLLDVHAAPHDTPIFLKSDTQGSDLQVLIGAGKRLDQVVGVMIEMSVQPIYEGTPIHWDMLDFLRHRGFEPFGFAAVTRDALGNLVEYDAIFWRSHRAGHATAPLTSML